MNLQATADTVQSPHALEAAEVARALSVDERGLSETEAAVRLGLTGPNAVEAPQRASFLPILWDAVREPFVVLLLIAGLLAVAVGATRDGILVLLGLLPIVAADVITSYRGERALEALRESTAPHALVRRDGSTAEINAEDLVPGDVVLLGTGDVVPADLRLSLAEGLLLDRSILTGESIPEPGAIAPDRADAPIVERHAIAYSGTSVVQGGGEGFVVATGRDTELGRIAARLGPQGERRSPIQRELDRLVRILLVVAVALITVTSGAALLRGETIAVAVVAGLSAAIAAIPEEPPVLLAVILGLGAYRLLRRKVLVRRLTAQETLSAVDLILTDKTGTLTRNQLELDAVLTPNGAIAAGSARRELVILALRAQDDAWLRVRGSRASSLTRALERDLGDDAGLETELRPELLRSAESVSSGHPYTRTVSERDGALLELLLGAPEVILDLLQDAAGSPWRALVSRLAETGSRLILLAGREGQDPFAAIALFCLSDPLREGAAASLRQASEAGIQTIVVTGDHLVTASRIADAAGLVGGTRVIGEEISRWDDDRLAREIADLRVVARAAPEQKLRIVEAAQRLGHTVAVTGDGVNDAPAMQRADVAVAMGSGTQVAREASDMVLGDDSFSTLMTGLREGRRMVANINKGLIFLLSTHVALLGYVLIGTLYGFSQPLLPIQILWIELFIDISASIAFEREPEEPDSMTRPPRPAHRPLLTNDLLGRITVAGGWTAVGALAVAASQGTDIEHGRWLAFNVLVFGQIVRAYANRSLTRSVLALGPNTVLLAAGIVAGAVQLAIPFVPALADAFGATHLTLQDLALVAFIALAPALVAQLIRARRGTTWVA